MFILLCSTSKCNYLTYNASLYTREKEEKGKRKEERGKRKEERGKRKKERGKRKKERGKRKKETVQLVSEMRKERTLKEVIVEREVISHTRYEPWHASTF
jgi:hypothetical protein